MKKKLFHKITALTLVRRIIQILSLILFPGLFIYTFASIKAIYVGLISGSLDASVLTGQIILTVSVLLITAIMGRFFCGFLCAFGTLGDFFWYLGSKLKIKRPKIGTKFDRLLKKLKYVLLVGIVLLIWTFGLSILEGTGNPWTVFGMLTKFSGWTELDTILSVGMGLMILIAIGSLYIERFFCRYLCPLGGIFAIVSKFRLFRIRKPRSKCGSCRACTKRCPMGIPLYRSNVVKNAECIDCMSCVEICPRDNVTTNPKPAIAAAVAVVALTGMYFEGNIAANNATEQRIAAVAASLSTKASVNAGGYTDGVYSGSAEGYHGVTSVTVTVESGYIMDVHVESTGDDAMFFSQARAQVIPAIIAAQSTDVDTVSGATYSSFGIMDAVSNALANVQPQIQTQVQNDPVTFELDSSALTPMPQMTPSPSPVPTPTPTPTPTIAPGPYALADGEYTGTGRGHKGDIDVTVTIVNGFITSITVDYNRETPKYFNRAETKTIDRVLAAQDVNVDTVSGATDSSSGILQAVADALGVSY